MSDLKIARNADGVFDLVFDGNDLVLTDDIETSVIISLFTWRRAGENDPLPNQGADLMGSWMDKTWENPNDEMGSKLWLLSSSKSTDQVLVDAQQYTLESLEWMLEDGVAESLNVNVEFDENDKSIILIFVGIQKPPGITEQFKFFFNWEAQEAKGISDGL